MTEFPDGYAAVPPELPEIRILHVQPGDVLVLRHELMLDEAQASEIGASMKARFPDNPCLILDGGLTLDAVLRREGGEQS